MKKYAVALIFFLSLGGVQAQEITVLETIVRVKQGPAYTFPTLFQIAPFEQVIPIAVSSDEQWVYIEYQQQYGWIAAQQLNGLPDGLTQFDISQIPVPSLPVENCITLVGDSVPHGEVVYKIEGHAFVILRNTPLSIILQEHLRQNGLDYLTLHDRSANKAFLSTLGWFPYFETPEYQALLEDSCRFTVIMPWMNDLSVERPNNASAYVDDLTALVTDLHQRSPETKIILLGYYYGQRADFVSIYAPGHTSENITLFNEFIFEACQPEGRLGQIPNVSCMETASLFTDLNNQHVVMGGTREDILSGLYEPIPEDVLPYFEVFWDQHPDGWIIGDGVHLSELGKNILADALIQYFLSLEPDL